MGVFLIFLDVEHALSGLYVRMPQYDMSLILAQNERLRYT